MWCVIMLQLQQQLDDYATKGDGHTWMSFSGQLVIEKELKVTGFRAAGLSVEVCSLSQIGE